MAKHSVVDGWLERVGEFLLTYAGRISWSALMMSFIVQSGKLIIDTDQDMPTIMANPGQLSTVLIQLWFVRLALLVAQAICLIFFFPIGWKRS